MARPFKAPIPVYGERGLHELPPDWVEEVAHAWIAPSQLAQEPRLVDFFGRRLAVARLAVLIDLSRIHAYRVAGVSVDADEVDDLFLTNVHPHVAVAITGFKAGRATGGGDPPRPGQMTQAEEETWQPVVESSQTVAELIRAMHPAITESSLMRLLLFREAPPPCWHSEEVHGRKRRGRRVTPTRRAATWGTYVLAWSLGSESQAVKVWDSLLLPQDFFWGIARRDLPYGLAKYVDAKARLVQQLKDLKFLPEHPLLWPLPPVPGPVRTILTNMLRMHLALQFQRPSDNPAALVNDFGWDGLAMFAMINHYKDVYKAVSQIGAPAKEVS